MENTPLSTAKNTRKTSGKSRTKSNRESLGSVEKLPSGRYRARYFREGAAFKAPHTFATKQAAFDWLATERSDRSRGTWLDPRLGREMLADYAYTWLASRPDLADRTRGLYRRQLETYIVSRVGGRKRR